MFESERPFLTRILPVSAGTGTDRLQRRCAYCRVKEDIFAVVWRFQPMDCASYFRLEMLPRPGQPASTLRFILAAK